MSDRSMQITADKWGHTSLITMEMLLFYTIAAIQINGPHFLTHIFHKSFCKTHQKGLSYTFKDKSATQFKKGRKRNHIL